jgi:hypothetical protein
LQSNVAKPPPAAEHEAEPHHHVAGEPLSIDDDGSLAGGVDGTVGGGVEEDLVEREVGEGIGAGDVKPSCTSASTRNGEPRNQTEETSVTMT